MANFKVEIPVTLKIAVYATDADAALRHINTAFAHAEPISSYVNLILRRGEQARAEVKDAIPTGEAELIEEEAE